MKHPWMPLYVGDYLANTGHLTTLQHGAYLLLIMHYWANGSLPTTDRELMAIARMTPQEWDGNCYAIAKFFDRNWRQKRIDVELTKAKSLSDKRALAGLKGAWSRYGSPVAQTWQMPTQSQSHIERGKPTKKETRPEPSLPRVGLADCHLPVRTRNNGSGDDN